MVNNKFMVTVEANSACGAEHIVLDTFADEINKYGVITGVQAFTAEEMKTDFFMNCLLNCETISRKEFEEKVNTFVELIEDTEKQHESNKKIYDEIRELEEKLEYKKKALYEGKGILIIKNKKAEEYKSNLI